MRTSVRATLEDGVDADFWTGPILVLTDSKTTE